MWAEPYGYARSAPPFVPPAPSPIAPALASEISGDWAKGNEWFAMSVRDGDSVAVLSLNCTGCCFKTLQGSARNAGAGAAELFLSGRRSQCGDYPDVVRGNMSFPQRDRERETETETERERETETERDRDRDRERETERQTIRWEGRQEDGSWQPIWTPWEKVH